MRVRARARKKVLVFSPALALTLVLILRREGSAIVGHGESKRGALLFLADGGVEDEGIVSGDGLRGYGYCYDAFFNHAFGGLESLRLHLRADSEASLSWARFGKAFGG